MPLTVLLTACFLTQPSQAAQHEATGHLSQYRHPSSVKTITDMALGQRDGGSPSGEVPFHQVTMIISLRCVKLTITT